MLEKDAGVVGRDGQYGYAGGRDDVEDYGGEGEMNLLGFASGS
jgi:hypothetical protein